MPETPPVVEIEDDEELDDASDLVDDKNPQVAALKREAIKRRKQVKALRAANADLTAKLAAAGTPKEGVITLEGEQATRWAAFENLGLAPDALATRLREGDELREHQRIGTAAQAVGWKAGVLGTLIRAEKLAVEMRPVEADGKTTHVPHVLQGEGAAVTATPLADYVAAHHPDFLPALTAAAAPEGQRKPVTPYPAQAPDGDRKKGLTVTEEAARRRARGEHPTI